MIAIAAVLVVLALGGAAFAFAGGGEAQQKRIAAVGGKPAVAVSARGPRGDGAVQRRKNVQAMLKEIESKQAETKQKMTLRRRLDQAGLQKVSTRTYYIVSAVFGLAVGGFVPFFAGQSALVSLLATLGLGGGLPRWVLSFLKARREKKFTEEFANAIDVIVRSVRSGLPTNEALKIVAREVPDPVGAEFNLLCESMKVGVSLEQGLKRMYDNMPTAEVSFFGIVMNVQQKSGGNLSEALGNLAGVLRDRKRLQGKIKAMSSEAKASAMIIGSLPPGVAAIVYITTPAYMLPLFTTHTGNLLLAVCAFWMGTGIFVMRKMMNFKH